MCCMRCREFETLKQADSLSSTPKQEQQMGGQRSRSNEHGAQYNSSAAQGSSNLKEPLTDR